MQGLLLLVLLLAFAAVAPTARAQSLEISGDGGGAVVESVAVRAAVEEGVALVDLDQTFRNPGDAVREGVWSIRLPEDAVVHSFSMWMEGKEKQGRVLEAGRARATYDSIVRARRDPALLEEVGWRTFRVSVFPIPARDTVRVRLVYAHVVPDDLGLHSLRVPLPSSPVGAIDVTAEVSAAAGLSACDAGDGAEIALRESGAKVRWSREAFTPKGPFEVRFVPRSRGFGLSLLAHRAADDPQGAFLVRVVPNLPAAPDLPRDVVFVVDRSGSMLGRKMEQAKAALDQGLRTLRAGDRFAVVSFASDVASSPLADATEANVTAARTAAASLEATGGTNLHAALASARGLLRDAGDRLPVVVLLTDGNPSVGETNPDRIVADWRGGRGDGSGGDRVRLFALGVGDDVKDFLLTRLARGSRGAAEYVREEERLEAKLSDLFEKVRAPLLTDPEISVEGVPVSSVEPRPLPDVFRGGAVVLAGRFVEGGKATLVLRGKQGKEPVEVRVPVEFPTVAAARPHVAQLWARMRIDRLLDDLRSAGSSDEIRREITDLGVKHQVVSPFTSFLVVEDGVRIADERESARVPGLPSPDGGGPTAGGPTAGSPTTGGGDVGGGPTTGGGPRRTAGHGGSYRGPSGEVPPDSREPSDPPPDPEGSGPGTPGGDAAGPPPSGGGGGPPTGAGAHALGTGGRSLRAAPGYEHWSFWFEAEAEALLADDLPVPGPALDAAVLERRILPALRKALGDPDVASSVQAEALESLLRCGDRDPALLARIEALQRDGSSAKDPLASPACVARALLSPVWLDDRTEATRERLLAVVEDAARPARERSFAAVALGLLGERAGGRVAAVLLAVADRPGIDPARPACLFAAGLLGDPSAAPGLLRRLELRGDELAAAYAADALGRIGAVEPVDGFGRSEVVRRLLQLLADEKGSPTLVRRLVPRALSRLFARASATDRRLIVEALVRAAERDDDPSTHGAALLALGRIAASADTAADVRTAIVAALTRSAAAKPESRREHAALALGLAARGADGDAAFRALRDLRGSWTGVLPRATATARGFSRRPEFAPPLLALARDEGADVEVRKRAALAAACCGSKDAADAVTRLGVPPYGAPVLLRTILVAAPPSTSALLLDVLRSPDGSQAGLHVAAEGLGRIADEAAVLELVALLGDPQRSDLQRLMALRALGRRASRGDPLDRICDGFPYRHHVPALAELHALAAGR